MSRILAMIEFLPTDEGGRAAPLPKGRIGYVLAIGSQNFSCWVVNAGSKDVAPDDIAEVEVVFAAPDLAMPLLKEGTMFVLKDYRKVASGVVTKVFPG